jgi:hypothetical protein
MLCRMTRDEDFKLVKIQVPLYPSSPLSALSVLLSAVCGFVRELNCSCLGLFACFLQTHVLRVNIHCDGCRHKVKKLLQKIEGTHAQLFSNPPMFFLLVPSCTCGRSSGLSW